MELLKWQVSIQKQQLYFGEQQLDVLKIQCGFKPHDFLRRCTVLGVCTL